MCKDCENWKPKEIQCTNCVHSPSKGKICIKYVEGFSCFQQKTCGNCGWHGKHEENSAGICTRTAHPYSYSSNGIYTHDDCKADENSKYVEFDCSWKPKERIMNQDNCFKCGKLIEGLNLYNAQHISELTAFFHSVKNMSSKPICCECFEDYKNYIKKWLENGDFKPEPNEEVLLMPPAKWVESPDKKITTSLEDLVVNGYRIADTRTRNGRFAISITNHFIAGEYDTPEQAKAAVQKALGIRKVK